MITTPFVVRMSRELYEEAKEIADLLNEEMKSALEAESKAIREEVNNEHS